MAGFKALKDICGNFEQELRNVSKDLFAAKIGESFEDGVSKKMQDLKLFTSKLRLLRADPISRTLQITTQHDQNTVKSDYREVVALKIIEQQTVKSVTQIHAVKKLITTPNSVLDPELLERKEKIIDLLSDYHNEESNLQLVDSLLKEKEQELFLLRQKWDGLLGELRDMRETARGREAEDSGPLYAKLKFIVNKLELMRWLINKLVIPRSRGYDWLVDPHKRLKALRMSRNVITVDSIVQVNKLELMRWLINKLVIPRSRGYDWLVDPHKRLNALRMARNVITVDSIVQDN